MITKSEVIDAVLSGIVDANKFYSDISGGDWLIDAAVESVMQTKIAEKLHRTFNGGLASKDRKALILMEYPIAGIIDGKYGAARKRGPIPTVVNGSKRVDILVTNANEHPLIPIEIKRHPGGEGFGKDAKRILQILDRSDTRAGGSVKYGLICAFVYGQGRTARLAQDDMDKRIELCKESLQACVGDDDFEFETKNGELLQLESDDFWLGAGICVYLRRGRRADS